MSDVGGENPDPNDPGFLPDYISSRFILCVIISFRN
jgi:hypothetical protein